MPLSHSIHALCASLLLSGAAHAQEAAEDAPSPAFPETEIFLFDYDAEADANALSDGANVTSRAGYDNQPFFTKDSATFLYSRDDGTQTDIWEYDIARGTHTQITRTPESEFSPTPSPDNRTISMVFERNNSIWHLDRSTPDAPQWSLEAAGVTEPVGYFARNHATGDILFWSRYGFSVALTHADKPAYHFISGHAVPATPMVIPGTDMISFVHRQTNEEVWIKAFDPETRAIRPLTPIVGANANYTWSLDGAILQIEDGKLHRWREGGDGWDEIADLAQHGIASAARIAVSPDGRRIAIVGLPAE
ncbi:TolB family protein [Qipengyuania sp. DSG2-2]|uniref:TolB family protein n=1 Tax=Qipengyuania sp. DGS2-2 TaxID=3349631 RepID=UPI0036D3F3E3